MNECPTLQIGDKFGAEKWRISHSNPVWWRVSHSLHATHHRLATDWLPTGYSYYYTMVLYSYAGTSTVPLSGSTRSIRSIIVLVRYRYRFGSTLPCGACPGLYSCTLTLATAAFIETASGMLDATQQQRRARRCTMYSLTRLSFKDGAWGASRHHVRRWQLQQTEGQKRCRFLALNLLLR